MHNRSFFAMGIYFCIGGGNFMVFWHACVHSVHSHVHDVCVIHTYFENDNFKVICIRVL